MSEVKPMKKFRKRANFLRRVLRAIHNFGASFEKNNEFAHILNEKYLRQVVATMVIKPDSDVMDYGSRNGMYTFRGLVPTADEHNLHIYAVEDSTSMHQYATENAQHPRITYINQDILDPQFPLDDKRFSIIFSLYYLMNVNDYRACLRKMYDLLEDDGKLCLIIVIVLDDWFQFVKLLQDSPEWKWYGDQIPIPDFVKASWKGQDQKKLLTEAFGQAGFAIEKYEVVPEYNEFPSTEDCAEFLLAGCTAVAGGEGNLDSSEQYTRLEKECTTFLQERTSEMGGFAGCVTIGGPRRHRMNFVLAMIVARKQNLE